VRANILKILLYSFVFIENFLTPGTAASTEQNQSSGVYCRDCSEEFKALCSLAPWIGWKVCIMEAV
jgi:hypothetical protein